VKLVTTGAAVHASRSASGSDDGMGNEKEDLQSQAMDTDDDLGALGLESGGEEGLFLADDEDTSDADNPKENESGDVFVKDPS